MDYRKHRSVPRSYNPHLQPLGQTSIRDKRLRQRKQRVEWNLPRCRLSDIRLLVYYRHRKYWYADDRTHHANKV